MLLCGVCLAGFTSTTLLDVGTRELGHPLLWPQEVTSAFFIYGVFIGARWRRGAATICTCPRSRKHCVAARGVSIEVFNRAVIMAVGLFLVFFGWQNFLTGFGSFRMPSMLPIAYLYIAIPVCGALVALFSAGADRQRPAQRVCRSGSDGVARDVRL